MSRAVPTRAPWRALPLAAALVALGSAGCAAVQHPEGRAIEAFPGEGVLVVGQDTFRVHYLPEDAREVEEIGRALATAATRIAPWGAFTAPVDVKVYPDHASLERALRRYDYPWLRAWARYDDVFLQSPRSWGLFRDGPASVAELLTHELTHCLMYQLAAHRSSWLERDGTIPIWFREGMASWTAQQGRKRMSEAALAGWIHQTGRDPIREARDLYQHASGPVYAAAHWAFTFLVESYGVARVRAILAAMRLGADFDAAFRARMGLTRQDFEARFTRYLATGGWRGRVHPTPDALFTSPSMVAAGRGHARPPAAGAAAPPR